VSRLIALVITTRYGLDYRATGLPVPVFSRISIFRIFQSFWSQLIHLSNGYQRDLSMETKWPRHEATRSSSSSVEIREPWIYTSTPQRLFVTNLPLSPMQRISCVRVLEYQQTVQPIHFIWSCNPPDFLPLLRRHTR
jgi:hypothetical protein